MAAIDTTLTELAAHLAALPGEARRLTALVGAPGAGKSTAAAALAAALNGPRPGRAAVFAMDGYHYDDAVLAARGWQSRKGAPHTFDVAGFAQMLQRLAANAEPEIAVPVFDRDVEIARNAARIIPSSVQHLIVEGNYLLLDQAPWDALDGLFDVTVSLDVPMDVLESRLAARWQHLPADAGRRKLEQNDLPNARLVVAQSRPADFVVCQNG